MCKLLLITDDDKSKKIKIQAKKNKHNLRCISFLSLFPTCCLCQPLALRCHPCPWLVLYFFFGRRYICRYPRTPGTTVTSDFRMEWMSASIFIYYSTACLLLHLIVNSYNLLLSIWWLLILLLTVAHWRLSL